MKRSERHLRDIFSDRSMEIDQRFKRTLKEEIMPKANTSAPTKRSAWLVPAAVLVTASVLFVLTQIPLKNGSNGDKKPIIELPTTQSVSAATLSQRSKAFQKNLHNVPFIAQVVSLQAGPQYGACNLGWMGPAPGEIWSSYAFMSKDSGAEAFYLSKKAADGTIRQRTSFYNPSSTQLSGVLDNLIGRPFALDDLAGTYMEIDKNGSKLENGQYAVTEWHGKKVYQVYAAPRDGNLRCGDDEIVVKFIIDASSYALIATEQYRGLFDQADRLIYRYTEDVTVQQLTETQAINQMTKVGFDKAGALSEFPGHLGE